MHILFDMYLQRRSHISPPPPRHAEFFTRAAWLYNLEYDHPAFDRNITIAWASCGAIPLNPYHLQLSQPFSNHQVWT